MASAVAEEFRHAVADAEHVVVFTGAGASADSGIPTFRGNASAWWAGLMGGWFVLPVFGTPLGWRYIPSISWYLFNTFMRMPVAAALPNATHRYFAELSKKNNVVVVTQNVDGLHQKAGHDASNVYEVHGTVWRSVCGECHVVLDESNPKSGLISFEVAACACGGRPRPDAVLFTERLPTETIEKAQNRIESMGKAVVVIVGLSGNVPTCSRLIARASEGRDVFVVDPAPPDPSVFGLGDTDTVHHIAAKAGEFFSEFIQKK